MKKFTLIELLVVIAIIGILSSLLLPSLNRARNEAKKVVCISNFKQVGVQLSLYTSEEDGTLPGIIDSFFTIPVVKDNNLPGFLRHVNDQELDDDYELFMCPGFVKSHSGRTDPRQVSMVNVVGSIYDSNKRAFGRPNSSQAPWKITELDKPRESIAIYEIFKGTRGANHIPYAPLHGYKGTYPVRNELRFDNSVVTKPDLDSIN